MNVYEIHDTNANNLFSTYLDNNPMRNKYDVEKYYALNDWYLFIKFRNGEKIIYDELDNKERYIQYENDNLTDEEMKKEFSIRLKDYMLHRGIDQEELANKLGTSQQMVSRYLRRTALPSFLMIQKIAKVLKCSVDDFYYKEY